MERDGAHEEGAAMRAWLMVGVLLWPGLVWAHSGRTDVCRGHTVTKRQRVGDSTAFQNLRDLEPGEYHFHVSPDQADQVMAFTSSLPIGSVFTLEGVEYEILPRTRTGEVLLRCETPSGEQPAGLVRVQR